MRSETQGPCKLKSETAGINDWTRARPRGCQCSWGGEEVCRGASYAKECGSCWACSERLTMEGEGGRLVGKPRQATSFHWALDIACPSTLGTCTAWQTVPLTGKAHEGVGIKACAWACMFGAVLSWAVDNNGGSNHMDTPAGRIDRPWDVPSLC